MTTRYTRRASNLAASAPPATVKPADRSTAAHQGAGGKPKAADRTLQRPISGPSAWRITVLPDSPPRHRPARGQHNLDNRGSQEQSLSPEDQGREQPHIQWLMKWIKGRSGAQER